MDYALQQRRAPRIPSSPSQTPRLREKAARDLKFGNENLSGSNDKGVNIQVILRCRPLTEVETKANTPVVIYCNEHTRDVSAIHNTTYKQMNRTFAFDKVFGPSSKQIELYEQVVSPLVDEVLEGYNCTIFAYGQTGSGKTYTMEGAREAKYGGLSDNVGMIPRAVQQMFDVVEGQHAEYSMKVTFLELYNEEIINLLVKEECPKSLGYKFRKPMTLMEDGKGGFVIKGLEEETVWTAEEVYKILEQGSQKRHTAETFLNRQSNRSHSIFSVTVHIKECTPEGKELIKFGKLNFVDLAGSENILRSGAREERAREAGENNKSLLSLGRVINSLSEYSAHIPYRDSKLTMLLKESLGGKTKTCIIATISPSLYCLEETVSTLDYAYRAKNIRNRPEVNQKIIKSVLIKDLYKEIDRLKQEVHAARGKNGIYVTRDHNQNQEAEKKVMAKRIKLMECDRELKDNQLMELQQLYMHQRKLTAELSEELERTQKEYEKSEHSFLDQEDRYRQSIAKIREREYLISNLLQSEERLIEQGMELRAELENAALEVSGLFSKIDRKYKIEEGNRILIQNYHTQLAHKLEDLHEIVADSVTQQEQHMELIDEDMQSFVSRKEEVREELQEQIRKQKDLFGSGVKSLVELSGELYEGSQLVLGNLHSEISCNFSSLGGHFRDVILEADAMLNDLHVSICNQVDGLVAYAQQQFESHSRTLQTTESISKVAMNFFNTLSTHASKLTEMLEDIKAINAQKLYELEKKFEECVANEERLLLEKFAELLASSNARKKKLVQAEVCGLREIIASKFFELCQELSKMQNLTSVREELKAYTEKTETQYVNNINLVNKGKVGLEEGFQNCMSKARTCARQWKNSQDSLLCLQKRNVDSVESIVRGGVEINQRIHAQLSFTASSALEEADAATQSLLSSVENALKLDHDTQGSIDSIIAPSCEEVREMKNAHHQKIVDIIENGKNKLMDEYMVEEPSGSTPRKGTLHLSSTASIEKTRSLAFMESLEPLEAEPAKQENEDVSN